MRCLSPPSFFSDDDFDALMLPFARDPEKNPLLGIHQKKIFPGTGMHGKNRVCLGSTRHNLFTYILCELSAKSYEVLPEELSLVKRVPVSVHFETSKIQKQGYVLPPKK